MEGDELLEMFHLNREGFKKLKENPLYVRQEIFGLNMEVKPQDAAVYSGENVFDVLLGEKLLLHVNMSIQCEHDFKVEYLKKS